MGLGRYTLDENGNPVLCEDLRVWGAWMQNAGAARVVGKTKVGDVEVSTVFLGFDYGFDHKASPVLWETMVFGGKLDQVQDRYTSKADAVAGHESMVARVKAHDAKGVVSVVRSRPVAHFPPRKVNFEE